MTYTKNIWFSFLSCMDNGLIQQHRWDEISHSKLSILPISPTKKIGLIIIIFYFFTKNCPCSFDFDYSCFYSNSPTFFPSFCLPVSCGGNYERKKKTHDKSWLRYHTITRVGLGYDLTISQTQQRLRCDISLILSLHCK